MDKAPNIPERAHLSTQQAAAYIGVCTRTLRAWITDPRIGLPAYRVGHKLLFNRREIDQFLARHKEMTVNPAAHVNAILASIQRRKE